MAGVTYRGMDARTSMIRFGMPAVASGIVLGATLPGVASGLLTVLAANPSALPWLFERLFAWMAYIAVTLSVVFGLLLSSKVLDAIAHRPVNFTLHQELAIAGVGMAGIHGMLLGLDASMPFSVAQILVPGQAPYAPLAVGVGQVALYLMALVTASFYVRRHIGQRAWRALHYLTFLAFAGSTAHGIAAGTDSGQAWAQWMYLGAMTVVAFLLAYRIGISVAERVARRARAASMA
jgi:DMSO/TMAO reductase YedYZ heme-binding membrane subunit